MNTATKDKKYLGREGESRGLEMSHSQDGYFFDARGRRYIDFFMGWCIGNVGWGVKEIHKKRRSFDGPDYVAPEFIYKPWAELAELLAKMAPGKLVKSFRATGGTEAVEIALQAAMFHTKRHKFIGIEGAYHGHSIGAMSVAQSDFRDWYKNLLPGCYKIKAPLDAKAAAKIEKLLSKRDIAAFIAEPIVCNLKVEIPTHEFWQRVSKACKKYGTLLIIDEVATGFGRTGKMFASEHYNLQPDILCLAKALTGGFGALGATMMTAEVAKSFSFDFSYYSSFGWHPLNVHATIANLKYLQKHGAKFLANANRMGKYFEERLSKMKFKGDVQVRVKGLAIGFKFKDIKYRKNIYNKAQKNGLLLPDSCSMFPPLNISQKVAKEGLDIFESCL